MKVYSCPTEVKMPKTDYTNYDYEKVQQQETEHRAALKLWLIKSGYTGKRTGETVHFPVADGSAEYMLADGKKSLLIHLPYGDAWNYDAVQFLPKAEILRRIDTDKKFAVLFAVKEKVAAKVV
jgi:hypothetical protein